MIKSPRVRFAPSPTGHLHIGGVRTAIYNWAFAKKNGGSFILRIDDTDPERSTVENTEAILRAMKWVGLDWDEGPEVGGSAGPYYQSERASKYEDALASLIESGNAYPCFCTPEELSQRREVAQREGSYYGYDRKCRNIPVDIARTKIDAGQEHTWRLAVPLEGDDIVFEDAVYSESRFSLAVMDDLVLMRSNRTPTYNFVTVVDDLDMGITHVIRGDDHLSNTPRQILIYNALGVQVPIFAHLPMILGEDGKRLSKRHGATSVEAFANMGYVPDAILNYLALLGWSLDGETTIISPEELCDNFTLERISKNPAIFDSAKLDWMNSVYLREMGSHDFIDALLPFLEQAGFVGEDGRALSEDVKMRQAWYEKIYPLINERVKTLNAAPKILQFIFSSDIRYEQASVEKIILKDKYAATVVLNAYITALSDEALNWTLDGIESALRTLPDDLEMKPRIVFQVARVALCGSQISPPLFESIELLGKEKTIRRLKQAQKEFGL